MRILIVALALLSSACVTLGTHEALQKEHAETKERLAQAQLELAARTHELDVSKKHGVDLEGNLRTAGDEKTALQGQISDKEKQLKDVQAQLDKANGEMAQALKDKAQ